MKKKLNVLQGGRETLAKEASNALYQFAIHGCEKSKQRVLQLDERLAHRGSLREIPAKDQET